MDAFIEKLAHMAAEKRARNYYGGYYGGGGMMNAPRTYMRRGRDRYMGVDPNFVPGMLQGQQAQLAGLVGNLGQMNQGQQLINQYAQQAGEQPKMTDLRSTELGTLYNDSNKQLENLGSQEAEMRKAIMARQAERQRLQSEMEAARGATQGSFWGKGWFSDSAEMAAQRKAEAAWKAFNENDPHLDKDLADIRARQAQAQQARGALEKRYTGSADVRSGIEQGLASDKANERKGLVQNALEGAAGGANKTREMTGQAPVAAPNVQAQPEAPRPQPQAPPQYQPPQWQHPAAPAGQPPAQQQAAPAPAPHPAAPAPAPHPATPMAGGAKPGPVMHKPASALHSARLVWLHDESEKAARALVSRFRK